MEIALYIIIFILLAVILALVLRPRKVEVPAMAELEAKLRYALASADSVKEIQELLKDLPHDVLTSITRSQGTRSGKLHELLATLEMTKYDRLFYIGAPIDFIGIDYEKGIDFIEVKSGRARFSEDEIKLKDLVECKMVNYVSLNVNRINVAEEMGGGEGE
ncbi:MAG: Holliday junction resolvase-like protein [Dehalococcoidales bacterium]|jgi:predicted Holliday junction resolvase-like endonuclease|nr:Holliday junction resolvase-like protein [Dehalococcoidales bacterium]MDP7525061.1 Holliday junction resolvase-like protein [Dehalococcoidales bacterium]